MDAATIRSARSLRKHFAVLLQICELNGPVTLWEKYKEDLPEDYHYQGQILLPHLNINFSYEFFNRSLINIEDSLLIASGNDMSFYGLTKVIRTGSHTLATSVFQDMTLILFNNTSTKICRSCFKTSNMHTMMSTLPFGNIKEVFSC